MEFRTGYEIKHREQQKVSRQTKFVKFLQPSPLQVN